MGNVNSLYFSTQQNGHNGVTIVQLESIKRCIVRNGLTGIVGGSACDKPLASQDDLNNKECVKKERLLKVRGEAMDVSVLLFGVWSCENFFMFCNIRI
jgi:hypothetical protein